MLNETLKNRLAKDRPVTSITLRIPVDVVESLKAIAPHKGLSGYQTLLKSYISEGLRRDEAAYAPHAVERLTRALKKRGVSKKILEDAMRDVAPRFIVGYRALNDAQTATPRIHLPAKARRSGRVEKIAVASGLQRRAVAPDKNMPNIGTIVPKTGTTQSGSPGNHPSTRCS